MKKSSYLTFLTAFLLFSISSIRVSGQDKELKAGYYLTIAAYSKNKEHYAKAYADKVRSDGHEVAYDFFPKKNYYFVYLKYYDDFNTSIRDLYQTRKNTEFDDCWVYVMRQSEVVEKALNKEVSSLNDMFAARFSDTDEEEVDETEEPISSTKDTNENLSDKNEQVLLSDEDKVIESSSSKASEIPSSIAEEKTNSKNVFLSLFFGRTGKEVQGQVQLIDASNHELLRKYDGNKVIAMDDPNNGNGDLILISDVFGYKKVQHDFNYLDPIDSEEYPYVTNIEDTIVVNFELGRYTKGDIATMYNVFFYKDAAIMRPQSKYEINELTSMLKENPQMKIRIHGHTNGSAHGPIIKMNDGASNYFSLSSDDKKSIGSAKKLSQERASMIKQYLENEGIDSRNIEIKAWGGKSELHHKHSSQAHKNVRVEIEVLQD